MSKAEEGSLSPFAGEGAGCYPAYSGRVLPLPVGKVRWREAGRAALGARGGLAAVLPCCQGSSAALLRGKLAGRASERRWCWRENGPALMRAIVPDFWSASERLLAISDCLNSGIACKGQLRERNSMQGIAVSYKFPLPGRRTLSGSAADGE